MKILTVIQQKGGGKKTTTAVNLAAIGEEHKPDATIIFDTNTDQPTATKWSIVRKNVQKKDTPIVVSTPYSLLQDNIKKAQDSGADLVIIDTGAQANTAALTAARLADLIIIPQIPSAFDTWEITINLDIAKLAGKPAVFLMTDVSEKEKVRDAEIAELKGILEELNVEVCPYYTTHRDTYKNASKSGLSVVEYRRNSLAAQEMQAIYKWILNRVNL